MTPEESRRFDRSMNIVALIAALALAAPVYFAVQAFAGNGALGAAISLVVFPGAWMATMAMACNFLISRHFRHRHDEAQP